MKDIFSGGVWHFATTRGDLCLLLASDAETKRLPSSHSARKERRQARWQRRQIDLDGTRADAGPRCRIRRNPGTFARAYGLVSCTFAPGLHVKSSY